jgi:hypothetical protein
MRKSKKYVPYKYKCKGKAIIDGRTGALTTFSPRDKHNK